MTNVFSQSLKDILADEAVQSKKLTERRKSLSASGRAEAEWAAGRLTEPQFWTLLSHAIKEDGRCGRIGGNIVFRNLEERKILRHVRGTPQTSELTGFGWDVAAVAVEDLVFEEAS